MRLSCSTDGSGSSTKLWDYISRFKRFDGVIPKPLANRIVGLSKVEEPIRRHFMMQMIQVRRSELDAWHKVR